MEKDKNFGLNENEYKLICELMKGRIFNLGVKWWRENTVSTMKSNYKLDDLASKYDANLSDLIDKLNALSAIEYLELMKTTLALWSPFNDPEKSYEMKVSMTPSEKIKEILKQTKN